MHYLVIARDQEDAHQRRLSQRSAHLAGAAKLKEAGKLIYAVAMIEAGQMVGSVMVFNFDTPEEFEAYKKNEPYITGNVWGDLEVMECAVPPLFT
jgi:uncharacterized protein YciI